VLVGMDPGRLSRWNRDDADVPEARLQGVMHPLIYDWNRTETANPAGVMLVHEPLRDGLQSPSVRCPTIDEKLRILHLIDQLGIDTANLGLPGAGPHGGEGGG